MSWPKVRIGEVATINPRLPKDTDLSQEVSFLGMASVSEEGQLLTEEARVLADVKKGFTYFERGDVLLAKITPCFENGKCLKPGKISREIGFGSTEFHVVRTDESKLDAQYLFYMVWSNRFRFFGEKSMSGAAGQKRVSADFLRNYEIPLPPLKEQQRIAAILDKADAIRRKRQQAIALADEFLRAVFLDMFGDPVTNPKGWELKPLSSLVSKLGDGLHGTPVYDSEGSYFFINGNNLKDGAIEIGEKTKTLSKDEFSKHKKDLNETTMLVSINGTIGNVAFYRGEPVVLGKSACYFNVIEGAICRTYLYHLIQSHYFLHYVGSVVTGSTIKNVSLKSMREMPIPIPSEILQKKFREISKSVRVWLENIQLASEGGVSFFNALSQGAFSGELK